MGIIISSERISRGSSVAHYGDNGEVTRVETDENIYITTEKPVDDSVYVDIGFTVNKIKDAEQLVSGWANVSVNADGSLPLDWQGDIIAPETLEKAAVNFMLNYRESGEMHQGGPVGTVVESIVLTKEKQEAIGIPEGAVPQGWFITVKVHDPEVYAKVKNGTYKMFSIQGTGRRVETL